jgi:hypothetical protein
MPRVSNRRLLFSTLLVTQAVFSCLAQAQHDNNDDQGTVPQISGVWRGKSDCVIKDSPCHDEVNVYRFAQIESKAGHFTCEGSKVVDGKEIPMGALTWRYDTKTHTLESENSGASFRLVVKAGEMDGTVTLPNHILYRRIHLIKEN